jgi:hypothetical protein
MMLWSMVFRSFVRAVTSCFLMRGFDRGQGCVRGICDGKHAKQQRYENYRNYSTHLLPFPVVPKD